MPKKRKAFVHVGLGGPGDVVAAATLRHRDALAELGVRVPAKTSDESFRAAIEILREHKAWGFARREVEGAWAHLCRRAQKGKDTVLVSQPLLATAEPEQVALLVDGLAGFEVHVIVTAERPHAWTVPGDPETDLGPVLDRWATAVRHPDRLHVVLVDAAAGDTAAAARATWKQVGRVVGFGTASLRLDDLDRPQGARSLALVRAVPEARRPVLQALAAGWADRIALGGFTVHGDGLDVLQNGVGDGTDPADLSEVDRALRDSVREVERLTRRTEALEAELARVDKKRRKLKRRLDDADGPSSDTDDDRQPDVA